MRHDYTHIVLVLDRSGSMGSIVDDTIGGFNTFLATQRREPGHATMTLRLFESVPLEPAYVFKPLHEAPELSTSSYVPGGATALYDAIGLTIEETGEALKGMAESARPAKVVFAILTDGRENASRKFTASRIAQMIKLQSEAYKWEFVFLGANQNAILTARELNIEAGNTLSFAANAAGTRSAYASFGEKLSSFRADASARMDFDSQDRHAQTRAGVDPQMNEAEPPLP